MRRGRAVTKEEEKSGTRRKREGVVTNKKEEGLGLRNICA